MADEILNITRKINNAIRSDRIKRIALNTVLSVHKPRIFEKGQAEGGSQIGNYSTKPLSISKDRQARNTGKTYFKGGYAEYKTLIGKNPGYVNLRNTDQMQGDYGLIQNGGSFGFGFQNSDNSKKADYNTDHFNKDIFALSNSEVDLLANVLAFELNKAI